MRRMAKTACLAASVALTAASLSSPTFALPDRGGPPPPGYEPGYAYGEPDVSPPEGYTGHDRYDFLADAR
jgi:hypothetical protein